MKYKNIFIFINAKVDSIKFNHRGYCWSFKPEVVIATKRLH